MADKEIDKETEVAPKPKSTTKAKAKAKPKTSAKPKAKPKTRPKAEATSKANATDAAPYLKKDRETESSHTQPPAQKSYTSLVLLVVFTIVVITTAYKLNMQLNDLYVQTDTQENIAAIAPSLVAVTKTEPVSIEEDTPTISTPVQQPPPAYQQPREQARARPQGHSENRYETMQQRRQAFEKEMQIKKQEFDEIIQAHQQERDKLAAEQNDITLRMRQNHQETKNKVNEIRKQISELHEKIRQIMIESSVRETSRPQRKP